MPIASEETREDALLSALDRRTRLLVVSHTHSSTGTTVDLDRMGRHCRERGVLLMVDGIQALGTIPVDLSSVDIYAASFFKWMLSGFGIGVLVTSARARAAMAPAYQGYANMDDASQLQYAHVNMPAIYGLDATLDFFERIGWANGAPAGPRSRRPPGRRCRRAAVWISSRRRRSTPRSSSCAARMARRRGSGSQHRTSACPPAARACAFRPISTTRPKRSTSASPRWPASFNT